MTGKETLPLPKGFTKPDRDDHLVVTVAPLYSWLSRRRFRGGRSRGTLNALAKGAPFGCSFLLESFLKRYLMNFVRCHKATTQNVLYKIRKGQKRFLILSMTESTPDQSLENSWRGPFQRKQVFGNSPHIFFRAHCQVRELSIVTYSWIELGICPKKIKFVSNWLEAKEKKKFFIWKKKLSQKREKTLFSKVIKSSSNWLKSLGYNIWTCSEWFSWPKP